MIDYMKTLLRFLLSAAFFCLIAFGCDCEKCPEKRPEYGYPEAEYHKAGSILMYTPGAAHCMTQVLNRAEVK